MLSGRVENCPATLWGGPAMTRILPFGNLSTSWLLACHPDGSCPLQGPGFAGQCHHSTDICTSSSPAPAPCSHTQYSPLFFFFWTCSSVASLNFSSALLYLPLFRIGRLFPHLALPFPPFGSAISSHAAFSRATASLGGSPEPLSSPSWAWPCLEASETGRSWPGFSSLQPYYVQSGIAASC